MRVLYLISLCLLIFPSDVLAARCREDMSQQVTFNNLDSSVSVVACVAKGFVGGMQRVDWSVTNITSDKLNITFNKVYTLSCGASETRKANIVVKPNGTTEGSAFSGDLDLGDAPEVKARCGKDGYISRVSVTNFRVRNVSSEERQAEQKKREEERRQQEAARQREREQKRQQEQREAERRQREQEAQRRQKEKAQQDRQTRQQREYEQRKQQEEAGRQRALEHLEQTRQNLDRQFEGYRRQSEERMQKLEQERGQRYDRSISETGRSQSKWERRAERHEDNARAEEGQLREVEAEKKKADAEYENMIEEMLRESK